MADAVSKFSYAELKVNFVEGFGVHVSRFLSFKLF